MILSKTYKEVIIVALLLTVLILMNKCNNDNKIKDSLADNLNSKTTYFTNKLGTQTATIKTLQLDKNILKNEIVKKDKELQALVKEFSRVKSIVKYKTTTTIDSILIPFDKPIPCAFSTKGTFKNDCFNFDYDLTQNSFVLNDFLLENETTVINGFKRSWFLGKQYATTDVINSNKCVKTSEMKSYEVVIPKRFYDTRLFNIGVGLTAGLLMR